MVGLHPSRIAVDAFVTAVPVFKTALRLSVGGLRSAAIVLHPSTASPQLQVVTPYPYEINLPGNGGKFREIPVQNQKGEGAA